MKSSDLMPPTQRPVLPSAGYDYRIATPHRFVRLQAVDGGFGSERGCVYACEETGAERQWGHW